MNRIILTLFLAAASFVDVSLAQEIPERQGLNSNNEWKLTSPPLEFDLDREAQQETSPEPATSGKLSPSNRFGLGSIWTEEVHGTLERLRSSSLDFAKDTATDSFGILTAPVEWNQEDWLKAGMVGLTTGGLFLVEKSVRRRVGDTEEAHEWNSLIRPLGLAPTFGLVTGGFLTSGYLLERPEDLATARLLVEAVIIDQMFVEGLKLTSGRARPNANGGDTSFAPLTGGKSFPSGETSFAFTVAGVVSEQYDQAPVKVLAYGLATAVGAARIAEDAHWASDVFVGAALGLAVSRAVVRRHSARSSHPGSGQKDKNSNFIVFPAGLLWEYRF